MSLNKYLIYPMTVVGSYLWSTNATTPGRERAWEGSTESSLAEAHLESTKAADNSPGTDMKGCLVLLGCNHCECLYSKLHFSIIKYCVSLQNHRRAHLWDWEGSTESSLAEAHLESTKAADNSPGTDMKGCLVLLGCNHCECLYSKLHFSIIKYCVSLQNHRRAHLWECRQHILPPRCFAVSLHTSQWAHSLGTCCQAKAASKQHKNASHLSSVSNSWLPRLMPLSSLRSFAPLRTV